VQSADRAAPTRWIEEKIERWLGLEINRDKTRVVNLKEEKASLDFLGYTFRWDRDLYGSNRRYLNVEPSKKALQRQRDRLNELTDRRQGCTPIPRLITKLNRQLKGWANYFSYGYPLFLRLPAQSVPEDQLAPRLPAGESLEAPSQPAPIPTAGRDDVLRPSPTAWFTVPSSSTWR